MDIFKITFQPKKFRPGEYLIRLKKVLGTKTNFNLSDFDKILRVDGITLSDTDSIIKGLQQMDLIVIF